MIMDATRKQKQIIHITVNEIGLARDDYENLLEREFGVRSSTALTAAQATRFIRLLRDYRGPRKPSAPRRVALEKPAGPADPDAAITPEQQQVVAGLVEFLGIREVARRELCQRVCKTHWPQTHADGQKLIYALVSIGARDLLGSVQNIALRNEPITEWERGFLFKNERNALDELKRCADAKGRRGARTMPRLSLTKLLEILNKYKLRSHA